MLLNPHYSQESAGLIFSFCIVTLGKDRILPESGIMQVKGWAVRRYKGWAVIMDVPRLGSYHRGTKAGQSSWKYTGWAVWRYTGWAVS